MGTKSRETIYGASVRAAAERAAEARREADRLAVEAWNKRMLAFQGPAPLSPTLSDAHSSFCHTTVNRTTFPKSGLIAGAVSMINLSPSNLK
jgi:hypothetical protein